jgi:hypothetical protein
MTRTKTTKGKMKNSKKEKVGALGGLFGFPITAVLRRLGKEGISTAHARDIMKAMKVKVSDITVSIQVNAGRNKDKERGKPAELTAGQLAELVHAAPSPAANDTGDKKK